MEQVVGVPVHGQAPSVSEEDVEQVADVPGFGHAPRASKPSIVSSAASLDFAEEQFERSFSQFFSKTKKVRGLGGSRLPMSSGSPARPRRGLMATWIPGSGLLAGSGNGSTAKSTMSIVMYTVPVMLPGLLTDTPWSKKAFREHMTLSLFGWRHTTVLSLTLTTMWLIDVYASLYLSLSNDWEHTWELPAGSLVREIQCGRSACVSCWNNIKLYVRRGSDCIELIPEWLNLVILTMARVTRTSCSGTWSSWRTPCL